MTKFLDGPAAGVVLALHCAPIFLRVVESPSHATCKDWWDALDQVDDTPQRHEKIYAYRIASFEGHIHILTGNPGRRGSGWFVNATYKLIEPQPDDATLRQNTEWAKWTESEYGKMSDDDKAALKLGRTNSSIAGN